MINSAHERFAGSRKWPRAGADGIRNLMGAGRTDLGDFLVRADLLAPSGCTAVHLA
jgi:hypothetical protein